jgi:hypothetical protein
MTGDPTHGHQYDAEAHDHGCEPTGPSHIYISGPMRGRDGFNFPAFFEAEAVIREMAPNADICNPAREDVVRFGLHDLLAEDPTGLLAGRELMNGSHPFGEAELRDALGGDLDYICKHCDMIVLLPEWEQSSGAKAEAATAKALGTVQIAFYDQEDEALQDFTAVVDDPLGLGDATRPGEAVSEPLTADSKDDEMRWRPDYYIAPDAVPARPDYRVSDEVRVTSATGGQKGSKLAAFDQVSPEVERLVAEHFGKGALKYDAHNFRRGYPWSLSYSALRRHLAAFWAGEEYDNHLPDCPEGCTDHTGSLHIVAVIWHAMVLTEFFLHRQEYDDRYVYTH